MDAFDHDFVRAIAKDKAPSDGGSIASYVKAIFKENPTLLTTRSNDEVLQRWLKDHPGEKQNLGSLRLAK
jgi:hypothetical protein